MSCTVGGFISSRKQSLSIMKQSHYISSVDAMVVRFNELDVDILFFKIGLDGL